MTSLVNSTLIRALLDCVARYAFMYTCTNNTVENSVLYFSH